MKARIPRATYRLQFHAGFTFREGIEILDYLNELGISDVYASPYFQAGTESTHGYDIADHNHLSPSVGDPADYRDFISALRERKMGQLLDFVPNHMGISEPLNIWWMSVLEDGISSEYASYFDIDWFPAKTDLAEKVLLPVLGDRYGIVLESGGFKLHYEKGSFFLTYDKTRLPISPRSYPILLGRAANALDELSRKDLCLISEEFAKVQSEPEKARLKKRLAELSSINPPVAESINKTLAEFEGRAGEPHSFDSLHELLEEQVYRLGYWRVAAEEINYRRFFDINTLAAIRVEVPEVFEASHQYVFELLARGDVTGLRIDHVDGLWNPREYFERLQNRYAQLCGTQENSKTLYLVVEKILEASGEQLQAEWRVQGTTGYEFANQTTRLLIDDSAEASLTKTYARFADTPLKYSDLVYEKKNLVIDLSFQSEIASLGRRLDRLSELHRHYRDFTRNTLTAAIRSVIACFPVYRTYASEEHHADEHEERRVLKAVSLARRRNPTIDKPVFDFIRNLLLLKFPEQITDEQRAAHRAFVMKFQQYTGPIMAKGVEDTVFYLFNRLTALNEVGGNPGMFGLSAADYHGINQERLALTPHTLLASSTHDTKRSEDVRLRIAALSEIPERWRKSVTRWYRLNRKFRMQIDAEIVPSSNEEYLLYQTLVGAWPLDGSIVGSQDFVQRIQEYMMKALKEGKVNSSWIEPNVEWEGAVSDFVGKILNTNNSQFLEDFRPFVEDVAYLGALNSLTQTVLKCTVPGVPDFYQGTEIWDLSLVDPDNRRKVDYGFRRQKLASLSNLTPVQMLANWKSGDIKLFLIRSLLDLRQRHPEFFTQANYVPAEVRGTYAGNIVAFTRSHSSGHLLVVVARCTSQVGAPPVGNCWGDTEILLEKPTWQNVFTTQISILTGAASEIFAELPVAVFWREP